MCEVNRRDQAGSGYGEIHFISEGKFPQWSREIRSGPLDYQKAVINLKGMKKRGSMEQAGKVRKGQ